VRRRTRVAAGVAGIVVAAAVALVAVGVGGVGGGGGDGTGSPSGGEPAGGDLPPATATVAETNLTQTEQVQGTLSYGVPQGVTSRSGGTLTWLPAEGATVGLGQPVYQVDGKPVVLIHGLVPPYRTLHTGVEGVDAAQLEQSLADLGYTGFEVDDAYTWSTATAVMQWQHDLGLEQTGTVEVDDVVVAAGDIRVALHGLPVGWVLTPDANETVLTYSGSTRVVTVALDVAKQHLVHQGIEATVTLPDGTEVGGAVAGVGTVATTATSATPGSSGSSDPTSETDGSDSSDPPTVTVTIEIDDQEALGAYDAAPVDVVLVSDTREDVLAVPVSALVALAEGGYGVEVVDGNQVSYVPVDTGMFAGGQVEISGDGIAEGTVVGVPS
jgi:peptidoglycan hydrolase-like protein with peptidoglycan-binding domain